MKTDDGFSEGEASNPRRVILTGSSGTLGGNILRQLVGCKRTEILAVHRQTSYEEPVVPNVRHEIIDFDDKRQLGALFDEFRPTCVIHCAAEGLIFPRVEWFELVRFNVDFTLLLAELTASQPGCHFIHVSTGLAYRSTGLPLCETDAMDNHHPYGASKAAADILLRSAAVEFGVPLTLFRPFSFTGMGDNRTRLFPSLLRAVEENRPLRLTPGNQVRDFCSAKDIARGIVSAVDRKRHVQFPEVYNLGSGRAATLRQLVEEIVDELEIPVTLEFGSHRYAPFEPMHLVANIDYVRRELQWSPRHRLAHAVWELARESFPSLHLREPREYHDF